MIIKLVVFIAALVAFAFFAGFNLDNRCNIWLFIKTYENVPVFMNTLISFAFGALVTLPLALTRRIKKQKQLDAKEKLQQEKKAKKLEEKKEAAENKAEKKTSKSKKKNKERENILAKIDDLKDEKSSDTVEEVSQEK